MIPIIAIVGRPNVGKSTIFNCLAGERKAIVHDRPGVTRDRQYDVNDRWGREVAIVDTGGLEPNPEDGLYAQMREQAMAAIEEADVILFIVDGQSGLTPLDSEVADVLRKATATVMLVINKIDTFSHDQLGNDFYELGFEEMELVSAAHMRGLGEMMDKALGFVEWKGGSHIPEEEGVLRISVLGRPNIGKSTLVNQMIGEERQIVHDAPGTTMDSVDTAFEVDGQQYVLVDTAGVRRRSRISDMVEGFAASRAIRTIERCHVTLLMIDGTLGPTEQDARLIHLAQERGRALIILINKWDLVRNDPERNASVLKDEMERKLPHATWASVIFISALTGKGVKNILGEVHKAYEQFDRRLTTAQCNKFLEDAVLAHSPPQKNNRPVRLNYMSQVRVRPPTFTVWCNAPEGIIRAYHRYLVNRLRDKFGFEGTPIRMKFVEKRRSDPEKWHQ
jgi:GTP-binding protein